MFRAFTIARPAGLALLCLAASLTMLPAPTAQAASAAPPKPIVLFANDPPINDLELAGGEGHVVATLPRPEGGSQLVELRAGEPPRVVRKFGGEASVPSIGRDASGKPVAVLSPCLSIDRNGLPKAPRCSLAVVQIGDGSVRRLPRSSAAYAGTLDGETAVVARRAERVGTRLAYLPAGGGAPRPLTLEQIASQAFRDDEYPATRVVSGLQLRAGTFAATIRVQAGAGYSALVQSHAGRPLTLLERSGYGEASGIPRVFRAPSVTPRGVIAFYDGGDNDAGWAGRWSRSGKRLAKVATHRYGVDTITPAAAWDGTRLVVMNCDVYVNDADEQPGCPVRSYGPLPLG